MLILAINRALRLPSKSRKKWRMFMKASLTLAVSLLMVAPAFAQGEGVSRSQTPLSAPHQGRAVQGEITSANYPLSSLTVLLGSTSGVPERADVNPDGSFEFRSADPGVHELTVTGPDGTVLYDEPVNIGGAGDRLSIRLPETPKASRASQGTVSIRQLQHNVPAQAQKALSKGRSAAAKGKTEEAMDEFREAVRIDPEFADAYNDLGALHASRGDLAAAVDEFRKAIDLVPDHRLALSNLCIVLGRMQRFDEAKPVARSALRIDPANATVHFVLAISLIGGSEGSEEALDHLQRAAPEIPMAHVFAAQLLINNGRRDEARTHLEEYLRTSPADDAHRSKVQAMLQQLVEQ
jgi:Flp pilus assembly protein TadD